MNGHYTIRAATVSIFRWSPSVLGWWTSHLLHPVRRDRAYVLSFWELGLGPLSSVILHLLGFSKDYSSSPSIWVLDFGCLPILSMFDMGRCVSADASRKVWSESRCSWQMMMMKRPLWRHICVWRHTESRGCVLVLNFAIYFAKNRENKRRSPDSNPRPWVD